MISNPRNKVIAISAFVLVVLGVSIFAYLQMSSGGETKNTVTKPGKKISVKRKTAKTAGSGDNMSESATEFKENLVYVKKSMPHSIVLLDTETRISSSEINAMIEANLPFEAGRFENTDVKISPDGKVLVFKRENYQRDAQSCTLYAMNMDGSNLRRIAPCKSFGVFAFGPDGKSVLFLGSDENLKQFDLSETSDSSVIEIMKNGYVSRGKFSDIDQISCVDGYVYWTSMVESHIEIWRKNLLATGDDSTATPRIVHRENRANIPILSAYDYIVYPDGKHLLISNGKTLNLYDMTERGTAHERLSRTIGTLNNREHLNHFFFHADANGDAWIYAEKTKFSDDFYNNEKGVKALVRFRANTTENARIEVVIPEFESLTGVSILPKNGEACEVKKLTINIEPISEARELSDTESDWNSDDESDDDAGFVVDAPIDRQYSVEIEDFNETLAYITKFRLQAEGPRLLLSFDTESKVLSKNLSEIIAANLPYEGKFNCEDQKISPDGKTIAFIMSQDLNTRGTRYSGYSIPVKKFIYAMDLDGSNFRRIVACDSDHGFDFGPDGKTILFIGQDGILKQIDLSGEESSIKVINQDDNIYEISHVEGYVYWKALMGADTEFWRKNLLDENAVSEFVYRSRLNPSRIYQIDYKVFPDGKRMLVSEDNVLTLVDLENRDAETNLPSTRNLGQSKHLKHFVFHTDANGQEWIYAERCNRVDGVLGSEYVPGVQALVRFRADTTENAEIEVVIPDFASYAGISIIPKKNEETA